MGTPTKPASPCGFLVSSPMGSCFHLSLPSKCHQHLISWSSPNLELHPGSSCFLQPHVQSKGNPCQLYVPNMPYDPPSAMPSLISCLRWCLPDSSLYKGNFSYLVLKSNLLSNTLKGCEYLVSPTFLSNSFNIHSWASFESVIAAVMAKMVMFLIVSFLLLLFYIVLRFFPPVLSEWYGFTGYFILQAAIVQHCRHSSVRSNCSQVWPSRPTYHLCPFDMSLPLL